MTGPPISSRLPAMPVLVGLAALLVGCNEQPVPSAPPPAEVRVALPVSRSLTRYLELTGQTSASKRVDLVARVSGTLSEIRYSDGAATKQGEVLFVIEPDSYRLSLQLAEAAEAQQKALLVQADADLARQKQLAQRQANSEAALDNAQSRRDSTAAAREHAAIQVAQAKLNLTYTQVRAPFDGIVSAHLVDKGALVGVGGPTPLASIVQSDPIKVRFSLDEQTVLRIREAMRLRGLTLAGLGNISVEIGLDTDSGYPHLGQLDYVAPELDKGSGTLAMTASVPNPNGVLLPGLYVRVRLPLQKDMPSLLVPEATIGASQTGRYALVVNGQDRIEQRAVEIGEASEGGLRVIRAGLSASDRVVVGRMQNAIPGSRVRPVTDAAKSAH